MALLDEIAARLAAQSVASSSGVGGWYLWRGMMPDERSPSHRAVLISETGGLAQLPNVAVDRPTFRVLVRGAPTIAVSTSYHEAWGKANDARSALHYLVAIALDGTQFAGIVATDEVSYMGEDANHRPRFAVNFQAWRCA